MQSLLQRWLGVNLNITGRLGVDKKIWHSRKLAKLERDHGLFIQEDGAEYSSAVTDISLIEGNNRFCSWTDVRPGLPHQTDFLLSEVHPK